MQLKNSHGSRSQTNRPKHLGGDQLPHISDPRAENVFALEGGRGIPQDDQSLTCVAN